MHIFDDFWAEGSIFRVNMSSPVMASRPPRVRDMKIIVELLPKRWTVLGVCLGSVPMTTLLLAVLQVSAVIVGVPAAWARLQVSTILFFD